MGWCCTQACPPFVPGMEHMRAITTFSLPARRAALPTAFGAPVDSRLVVLIAVIAFGRVDFDLGEGIVHRRR